MESLYGQVRERGLDLHVGVAVPPMTRTNLAGDDLSVWEHVEAGAAAKGIPSALVEPDDVTQVIVEGLQQRAFWIEPDIEQDERLFAGRTRAKIDHFHGIIQAKADSMIEHRPPNDYLWREFVTARSSRQNCLISVRVSTPDRALCARAGGGGFGKTRRHAGAVDQGRGS